jgi:hypothetical protein
MRHSATCGRGPQREPAPVNRGRGAVLTRSLSTVAVFLSALLLWSAVSGLVEGVHEFIDGWRLEAP